MLDLKAMKGKTKMFEKIRFTNARILLDVLKERFPQKYKNIYENDKNLIVEAIIKESENAFKTLMTIFNLLVIQEKIDDSRFYNYHYEALKLAIEKDLDMSNFAMEFDEYVKKVRNIGIEAMKMSYEEIIKYSYDEDKILYQKDFKKMIDVVKATKNLYLWGNAGNGKTTFAYNVASEMGLRLFNINSVKNEYSVKGFFDLDGKYQKSLYEVWYEEGGVLLLDEVDSYSSNGMLYLNNGIEVNSKYLTLENGDEIKKHRDCYVIACANTNGEGKTSDYIGRNAIDKAFMSRFSKIQYKEYAFIHKAILKDNYKEIKTFYNKKHEDLTTRLSVKLNQLLETFTINELIEMIENKEIEL